MLNVRCKAFRAIAFVSCAVISAPILAEPLHEAAHGAKTLAAYIRSLAAQRPGWYTDSPTPVQYGSNPARDPVHRAIWTDAEIDDAQSAMQLQSASASLVPALDLQGPPQWVSQ